MAYLGVNIDHVATLRQARYREATGVRIEPDVLAAAREAESAGAHGITVHLREDRRHIQDRDVRQLRAAIKTRLNLELANVPEILAIALRIKPDEVCLVPENRREVTTEGGLNVRRDVRSLTRAVSRFRDAGIEVSMFIDPNEAQLRASAEVGATFVELHTGQYAICRGRPAAAELRKLKRAAELGHQLGLRINAGHGLNYQNTKPILALPHLETLNIGHSIVSRAIFVGLSQAVKEMLQILQAR